MHPFHARLLAASLLSSGLWLSQGAPISAAGPQPTPRLAQRAQATAATLSQVARIKVDPLPVTIAVNPATNRLYTANTATSSDVHLSTVTVVDAAANVAMDSLDMSDLGLNAEGVAVNPNTDLVYTANGGNSAWNRDSIAVIDGASDSILGTIDLPPGTSPSHVAVNPSTNFIYTANDNGSLSVIDGAANTLVATVPAPHISNLAVNPATDQVYTANGTGRSVSVFTARGAFVKTIALAGLESTANVHAIAVNATTDVIYTANGDHTFSIIDGRTGDVSTWQVIPDGPDGEATGVAVNAAAKRAYVVDGGGGHVFAIDTTTPKPGLVAAFDGLGFLHGWDVVVNEQTGLVYVNEFHSSDVDVLKDSTVASPPPPPRVQAPIQTLASPQRVADTRTVGGPIASGQSRCFTVSGTAGIPADAAAVVMNLTAAGYPTRGWLVAYPAGQPVPGTSTLNFDTGEYAMANSTVMRLGTGGQVCVSVGTIDDAPGSAQVIVDVTGYLASTGRARVPMLRSPLRVADTRTTGGPVASGASRCFTVTGLPGIPATAAAVVLNVTAAGYGRQGWLTAYPAGQPVPATSTLNFDTSEYAMANGTVVRVGSGGQVCVTVGTVGGAAGSANVILDVAGYTTP